MTPDPHDELLERARRAIRELREKLAAAEARLQPEPIAVIGIGLQLPGGVSTVEQFWSMIAEGRDAVQRVPADRWNGDNFYSLDAATPGKMNTRSAAFLNEVRRFDAAFFDITPREAVRMDPQQRIFLETAWHALEDASLSKERLVGSNTGIFVGVHSHSADYHTMQLAKLSTMDAYSASGTAHDMIAGRLAYWLDLHGPAMTLNTACSSSLLAVHVACRSLRARDCSMAIVGGVNLLLSPSISVALAQLQMLAADGRCKSFDARADGMGRGEGCGVIVLKGLSAALRDGDRVQAVIRGSAVNQDGKTNGLTAPNGLAQRAVLRQALEDAGLEPWEIGYVEAHGTGTAMGDPIEVEALAEVLGGPKRMKPCTLGAVKANIGHLEGAAGVAGLIKTVLVLQHRWLPPVAGLGKLNPHLDFEQSTLRIPQSGSDWHTDARRLAGVSSFGWSGTNVHVILEEAPAPDRTTSVRGLLPLVVSAQSPEALRLLAGAFAERLQNATEPDRVHLCYTSTMRRTHHTYRIAVAGTDSREMAAQLRRRMDDFEGRNSEAAHWIGTRIEWPATGDSQQVEELQQKWETGAEVDWKAAFVSRGVVVDLPSYPFQGKEYWLEQDDKTIVPRKGEEVQDWLYTTQWRKKALGHLAVPSAVATSWLILHDGEDSGTDLGNAVRRRGNHVVHVRSGNSYSWQSAEEMTIGGDRARGLTRLVEELAGCGSMVRHVVYSAGEADAAELITRVLAWTQMVIRSGLSLKFWFVMRDGESRVALGYSSHAGLRGFSRVFGLEHPELCGGVIETDLQDMNAVCEEVFQEAGEDRVMLHQAGRWVARLERSGIAEKTKRLDLKPDHWYLVTGAFGRLGVEIASWLIERGARQLALIGRRGPEERSDTKLMVQLSAWRAQGITVVAKVCDVASEPEMQRLFAELQATGGALAGVIHAAASLHFSSIEEEDDEEVNSAFHAKVEGARVLDRCTRMEQLDFLVLFSSAAATIGLRNGALYAAANSAMDGVVAERTALELPILSVEWGLWEAGGEEEQKDLIGRSGFIGMRPSRALRVLESLMVSGLTTGLVADIDWTLLAAGLETRGRRNLVEEVGGVQPHAPEPREVISWWQELRVLTSTERRYRLLDLVAAETRKVFGMSPQEPLDESRGLFELGMDSLMSVTLERALEAKTGLALPATLTLNYPTIDLLAKYLDEALFPIVEESETSPRVQDDEAIAGVDDQLDGEDIQAAIAAELAAIHKKLGVR